MPAYSVSDRKIRALEAKMARLGLKDSDFEESFVRSGGPGGQNVNKVSTCVVLRHRATGLEVRCRKERSQALNRFLARRTLVDRIEALRLGKASARRREIERIRRQKRKRSKRAKEKMLEAKRFQSLKKAMREKIRDLSD